MAKEEKGLNPYLFFLSLYGILILPLQVHFTLRLGGGEGERGYRLQFEVIGLNSVKKKRKKRPSPMSPFRLEKELLTALYKNRSALFHIGRLTRLELRILLATGDAALTALTFSGLRTALSGLTQSKRLPFAFSYRLLANFEAEGSLLEAEGIISLRLGMLISALLRVYVLRLWLLYKKERKLLPVKEAA